MIYLSELTVCALALFPQPIELFGLEALTFNLCVAVIGTRRVALPGLAGDAGFARREYGARMVVYYGLAVPAFTGMIAMIIGNAWGVALLAAVVLVYTLLAILDTWELIFRAAHVSTEP